MAKKEDVFEMLACLIKEEGEETRKELREEFKTELGELKDEFKTDFGKLQRKMDEGFAGVNRRIDAIIQPQLDDHARRIKNLEEKAPAVHS